MSIISIPFTFTVGATIIASEHNSCFSTIYNDYNGNITSANISGSAAILDSQLAQITSASKVSGAAITSLSSVPSGAGLLPMANLATGTSVGNLVVLVSGTLSALPAVDGSVLKNLFSSILDYGTSTSSSTTRNNGSLKLVWGKATSVAGQGTASLTNLPFTTSTSYVTIATFSSTNAAIAEPVIASNASGSACTLTNCTNSTFDIMWFSIGT